MPQSLSARVFLLYAAMFSLCIFLSLSLYFHHYISQRLEDAQMTAGMLIEVTAQAIQESVIIGDYDAVKRTMETAVTHTSFDRVAFIDISGARIALGQESRTKGYVPQWLIDLFAERFYDVNRVISAGGRDYGVLRLSFDVATASEEVWSLIKATLTLTLGGLVVGLAVVRLLLMRWLTNLNTLKALEERVQVGELDAQAQLMQSAPLEIRQAIDVVNRTALSLRNQFGQRIDALMDALVQHKNALDQTAIVSEIDAGGRVTVVNDLYCDTLGIERGEVVGRPLAADEDDAQSAILSAEIWRGVVRRTRRDGSALWLNRTVIPIFDSQRAIEKWICIDLDISAQKLAEEELRVAHRQSEEMAERHLKAILDAVGDGVVIANQEGVITDVNRATQEIFGIPRGGLVGQPLTVLMAENAAARHDARMTDYLENRVAHVIGRTREDTGRRGNGELFPIELAVGNLESVGIPLFIGIVRDISERRKTQESLRRAKEMAEAGSRAKSEFLATMSHEIRTPMNGVLGMLSLLDYEDLKPDHRDKLTVARQSAESLLHILDDILDFSKLEAGRIEVELETCDPGYIAESVVQVLRPRAAEKGLDLTCRMQPSVPAAVVTDPTRLRQILYNLVGNAIKFTESGHVAVRARRAKQLDGRRVLLEFEVEDTGIGITPGAAKTLFQRFTQADSSITRRFGGTGLGLAICKDLCTLLGGTIRVDSAPGRGSVFIFSIGCDIGDPAAIHSAAAAEDPGKAPEPLPTLRILAVDDNPVNRNVVEAMLVRQGHTVTLAGNGLEAVDAVMRQGFDVVLMDVQMPEMDGLTATRRIRQLPEPQSRTPVVALTAHASEAAWKECAEAGMNAFATKPIRLPQLFSAISAAVRGTMAPEHTADVASSEPEHVKADENPL
ncbi:PAS domain S-box protein [Azospirillum canadense]|uniref:PAS domain S-box protein n=1 Tax=Azospirillum canadense TaxID=403962 RepID=UPI002226B215|nr:PAS domain S-box protein [Azospirillum canadense]